MYVADKFSYKKKLKRKTNVFQRIMKALNERITDVSFHLQTLAAPEFCSQVQDAVEKKDRNLLIKVCRKAKVPFFFKVPAIYLGTVVSVLFSIGPDQKWPDYV